MSHLLLGLSPSLVNPGSATGLAIMSWQSTWSEKYTIIDKYLPSATKFAKVMILHVSVYSEGLPQCMLVYPPPPGIRHPLGVDPPQEQTTPWEQTPRSRHPPPRSRPLRADTPQKTPQEQKPPGSSLPRSRHPPGAVHTGRYGQKAGSTHPTGMHSCSKYN